MGGSGLDRTGDFQNFADQWTIVYCFIWLSQQTGALQEAIALSKLNTIVNIRANENAMTQ